jgi:PKD repeat protein
MKQFPVAFLGLLCLSILCSPSYAQPIDLHPQRCANIEEITEERMQNDAEYRAYVLQLREKFKLELDTRNPDCSGGTIKIPVAVHYDAGVVPSGQESCATSIAVGQIADLNAQFRGNDPQNAAFNNFTSCFGNVIGDACIEFCLAVSGHPQGYGLADGDYAVTFGQIDFSEVTNGDGLYIPTDPNWAGYLNLFVADLPGNLLGQAYRPGNFSGEGAVMTACSFGVGDITCPGMSSSNASGCFSAYNEGNTVSHEVGHYFSLKHIWGDTESCGSDDSISDTPNSDNDLSIFESSCNTHNSCADLPSSCGSEDMYMNYMSYAADGCMYMFTSGQADNMYVIATSNGFTTSTPAVCLPPVAPAAAFTYNSGSVCPSDCIEFTDQSGNNPASWSWSFNVTSGDIVLDITSSTAQNPEVCIVSGTSGTLQATLTVTNGAGSDNDSESIVVSVLNVNDPVCEIACTQYAAGPFINYASASACFQSCPTIFSLPAWENIAFHLPGLDANVNYTLEFCSGYNENIWEGVITIAEVDIFNSNQIGNVLAKIAGCSINFTVPANGNYMAIISGDDNCGGSYNPTSNGTLTFTCNTGCYNCNNTFTDDNGDFFYSNNEDATYTICPDHPTDDITVSFLAIGMEGSMGNCTDQMEVYYGTSVSGNPIATLCGSSVAALPNNGAFTSTGPGECLTFRFTSDGSVTGAGWVATTSCSAALPVELINFDLRPTESALSLQWSTASEVNNEGFLLMRRAAWEDDFHELAFIQGGGNSQQLLSYQYTDRQLMSGVEYYYRLKQVDFDGGYEWSKIISGSLSSDFNTIFQAFPNPATDVVNILYQDEQSRSGQLQVYNTLGERINQYELTNGLVEVPINNWSNGIYFMSLYVGGALVKQERLVKH